MKNALLFIAFFLLNWSHEIESYFQIITQNNHKFGCSTSLFHNFRLRHANEEDLTSIARLYVDIFEGPFTVEERRSFKYRSLLQVSYDLLENHLTAQQKHNLPLAIFVASLPQSSRPIWRSSSYLTRTRHQSDQIVAAIEVGHWPKQQFQRSFPSMFIANLIVAPQYRRLRLASDLVALAEQYVLQNQSLPCIHTALLSNNTAAYRLYERNGYQVETDLSLPTEFSHVTIMTKQLS